MLKLEANESICGCWYPGELGRRILYGNERESAVSILGGKPRQEKLSQGKCGERERRLSSRNH